jgi:Lactoylglutathione lyase and related lyases
MIDAIDHVVLTSSNLENTLNFYCKVLGMNLKKDLIKEDGTVRYSLYFGKNKINIHELNNIFTPHARLVDTGTLDICFTSSKKISYWKSKLAKFNIEIIEGPVKRIGATSNLLSIYCKDPDGNLIEISNLIDKE